MITAKDRATLRGIAQKYTPVVTIGKGGITDQVIESIGFVIDKRELIKIRLLPNSGLEAKSASAEICEKLKADGIQFIGNIVVIYKRSNKKDAKHIL